MEKETAKLIEQLAQKLGTTVDYLWGVLIKQAVISAATDLTYLVICIISGIGLYKLHKYLSKEKDGKHSIYWEEEETVITPMIVLVVIWIILFLVCFFSIPNIINGFFNPEYWALQQILNSI